MWFVCTLTQPTNLLPIYSLTKSNEGWPTIWTNIVEEHLLKQKPTKQVWPPNTPQVHS